MSECFCKFHFKIEFRSCSARRKKEDRRRSREVRIVDIYSEFPFKLFDRSRSALTELVDAGFRANSSCVAPIPISFRNIRK